jgi:hypothetical protein
MRGAGIGVFCKVDLPRGAYVTTYDGRLFHGVLDAVGGTSSSRRVVDYALQVTCNTGRPGLRGEDKPRHQKYVLPVYDARLAAHRRCVRRGTFARSPNQNLRRGGVGHMLNDAVHPEVTGLSNNCEFDIPASSATTGRAYVVTREPVRAGTELLISYHVTYWAGRSAVASLPPKLAAFCRAMQRALAHFKAMSMELEAYVGGGRFVCSDTMRGGALVQVEQD